MTVQSIHLATLSDRNRLRTLCDQRKGRRKCRAFVHSIAVSRNRAAMKLDEMSNDCQPQSQPTKTPSRGTIGLTKSIEHTWQKLRINTLPGVFHRNARIRSVLVETYGDLTSVWSEFHCIR